MPEERDVDEPHRRHAQLHERDRPGEAQQFADFAAERAGLLQRRGGVRGVHGGEGCIAGLSQKQRRDPSAARIGCGTLGVGPVATRTCARGTISTTPPALRFRLPLGIRPGMDRRILHLDIDAFLASVEQLRDPSLRGRPVAVGTGVVASRSYEAKARGVATAMPLYEALRRCPDLVVRAGDGAAGGAMRRQRAHGRAAFLHS